ncbi:uncharacterized protein BXZ73DRAFT_75624 [Epithele typhae]|uniref:uncharacterized protein n=1 Tax=Epithele typhae TaxID=378194 RepID=UPI0020089A04|nr:uncharacterized protein BXZ73DRAFT_75624 [Epithele typhae]KAH9940549.1 hypothetical protein BXZ73DRAFT_75624 [Epithele typhae]
MSLCLFLTPSCADAGAGAETICASNQLQPTLHQPGFTIARLPSTATCYWDRPICVEGVARYRHGFIRQHILCSRIPRPCPRPVYPARSSSSSHTPTPSANSPSKSVSSRSRRKPASVFKSPSADDPGEWEAHAARKRASPYNRVPARRASSSTDTTRSSDPTSPVKTVAKHNAPSLPLYHPLGPLAQSLPPLDPGLFGLPSSLSIVDDSGDLNDGDAAGRSSSRAQRAPKSREPGIDESAGNGTPNGAEKTTDAPARDRNPSPRKRRGGPKRKRRETDDGDSGFPPPAKRTRNPRGVAANSSAPAAPSPLVGPAVVASDLVEDAPVPENNGDGEELPQEEFQAPKRSARTRKPRARPVKRRDSSGSATSGTSVSVPIAAATKAAPASADAAETHVEDNAASPHINGDVVLEDAAVLKSEPTPSPTPLSGPLPVSTPAPEVTVHLALASALANVTPGKGSTTSIPAATANSVTPAAGGRPESSPPVPKSSSPPPPAPAPKAAPSRSKAAASEPKAAVPEPKLPAPESKVTPTKVPAPIPPKPSTPAPPAAALTLASLPLPVSAPPKPVPASVPPRPLHASVPPKPVTVAPHMPTLARPLPPHMHKNGPQLLPPHLPSKPPPPQREEREEGELSDD